MGNGVSRYLWAAPALAMAVACSSTTTIVAPEPDASSPSSNDTADAGEDARDGSSTGADASDGSTVETKRVVFVTDAVTPGQLDDPSSGLASLAEPDALCMREAKSAGLSGTFVAWLSTPSVNAIDRLPVSGAWYLPDGTTRIFRSKDVIPSLPDHAIDMRADGRAVRDGYFHVWTGTDNNGRATGNDCASWTATSGTGTEGITNLRSNWTNYPAESNPTACGYSLHLYCFER